MAPSIVFLEPYTVAPSSSEHTHTLILLPDLGCCGERFAKEFLAATNFAEELPTVKPELQTEGLRSTSRFLWNLVAAEAKILDDIGVPSINGGYDHVIIGGMGQGCAASIIALLSGRDGEQVCLGGFVGLSGWLPRYHELLLATPFGMWRSHENCGLNTWDDQCEVINEVIRSYTLDLDPFSGAPAQLETAVYRLWSGG
ncbi:hypothetical protein BJY04DRAFT_223616 [Aspergillus karnatakaensis]|uniref:uncharacterized protein n=1 Tax=Aspergillus karnatakaensis TaxID=1810916 RepID=UPI003CCD5892